MKRKLIMPLVAIVFGVLSAFTSVMPPQQGWYKPLVGDPVQGAITSPSDTHVTPCGTTGANICKIDGFNAYNSSANAANAPNPQGLLMRD